MDWNIKTTFVISDLHFYHKGLFNIDPICKEIFGDVEGRVKLMTEWWNEIVKPTDSVIMLGDISFHKKGLQDIKNLNGMKYLIRGNHDLFSEERYLNEAGIIKIYPSLEISKVVLTHFPVHPSQLKTRYRGNIHGHVHRDTLYDTRYFNASAENINYRPKRLDEILEELL